MTNLLFVLLGVVIGALSGVLGLGGGILMVPILSFWGLNQHQAQGTTLAMMVPPIGLLAAFRYWKEGNVMMPIAVFGAIGFFFGGYIGGDIAQRVSEIF